MHKVKGITSGTRLKTGKRQHRNNSTSCVLRRSRHNISCSVAHSQFSSTPRPNGHNEPNIGIWSFQKEVLGKMANRRFILRGNNHFTVHRLLRVVKQLACQFGLAYLRRFDVVFHVLHFGNGKILET